MSAAQTVDPRERFLRAIAERIAPERIAAIHLFPAIRAGGRESAVAVVAAVADPSFEQAELPPPVGESAAGAAVPEDGHADGADATGAVESGAAADARGSGSDEVEERPSEDLEAAVGENAEDIGTPASGPAGGPPPEFHDTTTAPDAQHENDADPTDSPHHHPPRHVVYRAVYLWTRKGPDRGKWEVDITAEADAPLQAVSDVVRGVQRRAGEDDEPELITPEALRVALSQRPWAAAI